MNESIGWPPESANLTEMPGVMIKTHNNNTQKDVPEYFDALANRKANKINI